jgi:hypothetical protein
VDRKECADDKQIRLQKIKVKDLYKFACQVVSKAKKNDVIPITKGRAVAYANNPHADENDIGLLVVYMGEKCLGYLGIMPGLLKAGDRFSKVHWFSGWYVPPEFRVTSIGGVLLMNAFSLKYDLVITGLSRIAQRVLRSLGLHEIAPLAYCVLEINRLALLFSLAQKALRKIGIKPTLTDVIFRIPERIFCSPIKKILYNMLFYYHKGGMEEISYKEVSKVGNGPIEQAKYNAASTEFYRGTEVVNWMLQDKWMPELEKAEEADLNYYFFNARDISKFIALEVYSPDRRDYKGFLVLSVTSEGLKTVLKVLDFHFFNYADYKYILPLALKYAKIYLSDYIEFPASLGVYIKGGILTKFLFQKKKRIYFCHPKDKNSLMAVSLNDIKLNYCDGDTAFT